MLSITAYQSLEQMQSAHPEIKNFTTVHVIPRGQCAEKTLTTLKKKGVKSPAFIVGSLVWTEAITTPKVTSCPAA